MRNSIFHVLLATCFVFGMTSCGQPDGGSDGPDAGIEGVIEIIPAEAALSVQGAPAQQAFTATLHMTDGSTIDITDRANFSADNIRLGYFDGGLFTAGGSAAGRAVITASYQGLSGQASVTVSVTQTHIVEPAPTNAKELFDAAEEEPSRAPTIVYPADQTLVPPNLGDYDVHWTDGAGNDLYEITLISPYLDLRTYVTASPGADAWATIAPSLWSIVGASQRDNAIEVRVRGLAMSAPEQAGTSEPITTFLGTQDLLGGIYYWAASSDTKPAGIYRHDMARIGEDAEPFYTTSETPDSRCVACHVLSRDGERMAVTYDGGNGAGTILDVGSRAPLLAVNGEFAWNFATFEPGASRILTGHRGTLTLREVETGAEVTTVPSGGWATHPDFHPDGTAIVYIRAASPSQDWIFQGGAVVIQPFDRATATFGEPTVLVESAENNFYPSWSPDGEWILFNKSTEDSYDNGSAELYVIKADGTEPPFLLDKPNERSGLTNSWPRWAPFVQTLGQGQSAETFYWFTFSSKRDFGVRLVDADRPQIWMAPFFPQRTSTSQSPSTPAFRLPAQDIDGHNHIAQWTEHVIPVD